MPGAGGGCEQALDSLTVCMSFVTDITFYSIPETLSGLVGGEAGFNIMARVFAATARRIYSAVHARCCPGARDPVVLFERLERVTKLIGGAEYRARAVVERLGDGRVRLRFTGLDHLRNSVLNAAPIVGIVAGMVEAVGLRAVVASSPERARLAPGDAYVVYPERVGDNELDVIVAGPGG